MQFAARVLTIAGCLLCFAFLPARASDPAWMVVKTAGAVHVSAPNAAQQPASLSNLLAPGSIITTGGDGQLLITRGGQEILVGPNSRMALPAEEKDGFTRILQDMGTLLLKVDKRSVQHFEVKTPIVAAVVKGTTFAVTADLMGDSVHVAEGLVEVRAIHGGATAMVPAGETVFVSRQSPETIQFREAFDSDERPAPDGDDALKKAENASESESSAADQRTSPRATLQVPDAIGAEALDYFNLTDGLAGASPSAVDNAIANGGAAERSVTAGRAFGATNVLLDVPDLAGGNAAGSALSGLNLGLGNPGNGAGNGNANPNLGVGSPGSGAGNGNSSPDLDLGNPGGGAGNGNANPNLDLGNPGDGAGNGNSNPNLGLGNPGNGPGLPGPDLGPGGSGELPTPGGQGPGGPPSDPGLPG